MAKYLKINGKVCLDSWRGMLTAFFLMGKHTIEPCIKTLMNACQLWLYFLMQCIVLRSKYMRLPFGARDMNDRSDGITYGIHGLFDSFVYHRSHDQQKPEGA